MTTQRQTIDTVSVFDEADISLWNQYADISASHKEVKILAKNIVVIVHNIKLINTDNNDLRLDIVLTKLFDNFVVSTLKTYDCDLDTSKFSLSLKHPELPYGYWLACGTRKDVNGTSFVNNIVRIPINRPFSIEICIYRDL